MRIFEKDGIIVVSLNLEGRKYLRTFFSKDGLYRWVSNLTTN